MDGFLNAVKQASRLINIISGIFITFIITLTVADVILRSFRTPILGTYELVAFSGAIVIGFSIPITSWMRGHIYVDFFLLKLPRTVQNIFYLTTRCLVMVLFLLIGWNLIKMGIDLQRSGEVSLTLQLPFYPVAYGLAISCFFQCLVVVADIIRIPGGKHE